jgi:hypothetical protein
MVKRKYLHQIGRIVSIILMMQLIIQVTISIYCENNPSGLKPDRYYQLSGAKCIAFDAPCELGYKTAAYGSLYTAYYNCDDCASGYARNKTS